MTEQDAAKPPPTGLGQESVVLLHPRDVLLGEFGGHHT